MDERNIFLSFFFLSFLLVSFLLFLSFTFLLYFHRLLLSCLLSFFFSPSFLLSFSLTFVIYSIFFISMFRLLLSRFVFLFVFFHPVFFFFFLPSRLGLWNTPTPSLQRGKNPAPTSVLDMTLNNLMVRLK